MRIAVIGCGRMGKLHARKLACMNDVDLVGVVDNDDLKAEVLAEELGCDSFEEYWDLFGELDAAVVATPPHSHASICKSLIENSIHVLVEKPITTDVDEALSLCHLAHDTGMVLQVGHIERFNPVFKRIAETITHPFDVEAYRHSRVEFRQQDVDVVLDLMIHDIDLVLSLAQTEISKITASGAREAVIAKIKFIDGSSAILHANRKAGATSRFWSVNDEKHYLIGEYDCLTDELRQFIGCVRNGDKPRVNGQDGTAALKVALEISRQIQETP